jgi:hypothetical protein
MQQVATLEIILKLSLEESTLTMWTEITVKANRWAPIGFRPFFDLKNKYFV